MMFGQISHANPLRYNFLFHLTIFSETWILKDIKPELTSHIIEADKKSNGRNSLWKYFGISQTGVYAPEDAEIGEKIDLIFQEISSLKDSFNTGNSSETISGISKQEEIRKLTSEFLHLNNELKAINLELSELGNSISDKDRMERLQSYRMDLQEQIKLIISRIASLTP